jgi:ABC-type uncharacterized transport system auxiliary subunit
MKTLRKAAIALGAVALVLALASCATINRLDPYELQGSRLAAQMRTPPQPRVHVAYDVTLSSRNPVFSALSVLTNLAKASQAEKADQAMRVALDTVNVPDIVFTESYAACADALGASRAESKESSDFYLDIDIRDWGIRADSPASAVSLHMSVTASLFRTLGREMVWQRRLNVDQPASPAMFGLGQIVGNMVTATILYEMSAENLAAGFKEMARETSSRIVRLLQRDLDKARYGG